MSYAIQLITPFGILKKTRDNILFDKARLIYETAQPLAAELIIYLVTEDDINAINTLMRQYEEAIPEKRAAVAESKASTDTMRTVFHEIDFLLKDKLDNLMVIFRSSNLDFFKTYTNARIIIDLGRRKGTAGKTTISGIVEDFSPELPINGAYVWVVEKGISFTTGIDGRFTLDVGEAGNYTIRAEKQNYLNYSTDPISLQKGDQIEIEIELEPA